MREVRPTIFLGVPRVWEKLASGMHTYASSMGRLKRGLSNWAKEIGLRGNMSRQQGWVGLGEGHESVAGGGAGRGGRAGWVGLGEGHESAAGVGGAWGGA